MFIETAVDASDLLGETREIFALAEDPANAILGIVAGAVYRLF